MCKLYSHAFNKSINYNLPMGDDAAFFFPCSDFNIYVYNIATCLKFKFLTSNTFKVYFV